MKVHFKTYGCQMNERDSEAALALLSSKGHAAVSSEAEADIIILNTCSVREQAERKAIGKLGILKRLKREHPNLILGVMGCMAQRLGRELLDRLPHLDFVVGTDQIRCLPEIVEEVAISKGFRVSSTERAPLNLEGMDAHNRQMTAKPFSAFVSVSRGCNRFCSYCIVPYVRGRESSRSPDSIMEEVAALAHSGIKEIMLLGQNVAAYGLEGAALPIDDHVSPFASLLERISAIDGIKRIRFVSPHPAFFNSRLIEAMASLPKACNNVHLPLQSGSDRILKEMNRPYTAARYLEIARRLERLIPDMTFSTDIIVGFPGETDADFNATRNLMNEVSFDNAFIFKYSPRSGTKAAAMSDDIPMELKEERNQLLLEDHHKRMERRNAALRGRVLEVMAEGPSKRNESRWAGRTTTNKVVVFTPQGSLNLGDTLDLRIVKTTPMTLFGEQGA